MNNKIMQASKIGFSCDRNLWYTVNGAEAQIKQKTQRIFDVGKALEPIVVEWLMQDGWICFYNKGSQDAELELTECVRGGMIIGHPDVFMSRGEIQNVLADIKTMNEHHFMNWKRKGTLDAFPQYADQLSIYAYMAKKSGIPVEKLAVVGVNKNNSEMHIEFFDYDEARAVKIIERAERIFSLDNPPAQGDRIETWACSYCEYAHCCEIYKRSQAKDTAVGEGEVKTDNPKLVRCIEVLKEARDYIKCGKELEDDAKLVLDEEVRAKGLKSVNIGTLILTLTETSSSRLDSTALRKAHPELVQEFSKTTNSVTYRIKERV
ncbi:MAG: Dna2/Cas4 domain-containing protein [Synergistaceae bacterium]|nr:Dna2/Cas4 domain-containing protein [Synergistaceae bacterium]